ncbi:hypothetical protein EVAR_100236_1 [Eumeta japonica]|uniref:Uncharacterized protein n=1 Tax=Eumeta variegata TaxID=151549 RepID=A0A4C1ZS53_EUMVA|nr:hypothetical protein EVAR_100236_1 [Eumeta japonica]
MIGIGIRSCAGIGIQSGTGIVIYLERDCVCDQKQDSRRNRGRDGIGIRTEKEIEIRIIIMIAIARYERNNEERTAIAGVGQRGAAGARVLRRAPKPALQRVQLLSSRVWSVTVKSIIVICGRDILWPAWLQPENRLESRLARLIIRNDPGARCRRSSRGVKVHVLVAAGRTAPRLRLGSHRRVGIFMYRFNGGAEACMPGAG